MHRLYISAASRQLPTLGDRGARHESCKKLRATYSTLQVVSCTSALLLHGPLKGRWGAGHAVERKPDHASDYIGPVFSKVLGKEPVAADDALREVAMGSVDEGAIYKVKIGRWRNLAVKLTSSKLFRAVLRISRITQEPTMPGFHFGYAANARYSKEQRSCEGHSVLHLGPKLYSELVEFQERRHRA